jgi:hypothetical protein
VVHVNPGVYASSDPINVAYVQKLSVRRPKGCGPREVTPGAWVRLDCHKYKPIVSAHPHWSAAKARVMKKTIRANLRYLSHLGTFGASHPSGDRQSAAPPPAPVKPDPAGYPELVDHRTSNLEGPIKDQGYVGSCTAFSLSSTMDNMIKKAGTGEVTSPTHIWAHYGYPGMEEAGDGNLNKMITTYAEWPYSGKEACELATDDEEDCGDYYDVRPNTAKDDPKIQANLKKADRIRIRVRAPIRDRDRVPRRPPRFSRTTTAQTTSSSIRSPANAPRSVRTNPAPQAAAPPERSASRREARSQSRASPDDAPAQFTRPPIPGKSRAHEAC